jgi:hypothetical protein
VHSPIFVGIWNESTHGELFGTGTSLVYVALRNVSMTTTSLNPGNPNPPYVPITNGENNNYTELVIDDDYDLNVTCSGAGGSCEAQFGDPNDDRAIALNWTERFGAPLFIGSDFAVDGNNTVDADTIQIVLQNPNVNGFYTSVSNPDNVTTRVDANVTVRVCAKTFSRPQAPIIGASIALTTERFQSGGSPVTENLVMYNPFTGVNVSSIFTGPSGCASFNVSRLDSDGGRGWTVTQPNNIRGTVTSGSDSVGIFVGGVNVCFGSC